MSSVSRYLQADHRYCDGLFDLIEPLAAAHRWEEAHQALLAFRSALEQHLRREERVLFPAMEEVHGAAFPPTRVMRIEHDGMRALLSQAEAAVRACEGDRLAAILQTLCGMRQAHNMKEESVLYPMADALAGGEAGDLLQALEAQLRIAGR